MPDRLIHFSDFTQKPNNDDNIYCIYQQYHDAASGNRVHCIRLNLLPVGRQGTDWDRQ